ncbi:TIR domain-containing protein [Candidatus Uhrbacteria bacterium]|nr:TIR domain-containing protein [Candidatus Uhrbacteria bacterium]
MAYANKTYVAFDADNDIHYYRLMQAWKESENTTFDFHNAHDLNKLMGDSQEETIKAKLRERFDNAKLFVLLVGENTKYLYKFVRWEIEQAINRNLPIVVVNLNGKRSKDVDRCPAILNDVLTMHVSFNQKILGRAINSWVNEHYRLKAEGKSGDYYYGNQVYGSLGL